MKLMKSYQTASHLYTTRLTKSRLAAICPHMAGLTPEEEKMDRVKLEIEDGVAVLHLPEDLQYVRIFVGGKRIELKLDEDPIEARVVPFKLSA